MGARVSVVGHTLSVGLEGRPVDIALMVILDQHLPFVHRQLAYSFAPRAGFVEHRLSAILAIDIGTRINRIGKHGMNGVVTGLAPAQLVMSIKRQREFDFLRTQPQPDAARRAQLGETGKDGADDIFDGRVGMDQDLAVRLAPDEADRQAPAQFAAGGLVLDAAVKAGTQDVQFGLTHGAFQTEQKPVVEQRRVVDAVVIGNQRIGQPGEFDQPVPVGVVARQPRDLKAKHDADPGERDLTGQTGKSGCARRCRNRSGRDPRR